MQEKLEQRIQYLDPDQGVEEKTGQINFESEDNGLSSVIDTGLEEIDLTLRELEKNPFEELRWHLKERPTNYDVVNEIGKKTLRGIKSTYKYFSRKIKKSLTNLAENIVSKDNRVRRRGALRGIFDAYFFSPTYLRKSQIFDPKTYPLKKENYYKNAYLYSGVFFDWIPPMGLIAPTGIFILDQVTMQQYFGTSLLLPLTTNCLSGLYEIGRKIYLSQKKELEKKCSYDLNEDNNKKD